MDAICYLVVTLIILLLLPFVNLVGLYDAMCLYAFVYADYRYLPAGFVDFVVTLSYNYFINVTYYIHVIVTLFVSR